MDPEIAKLLEEIGAASVKEAGAKVNTALEEYRKTAEANATKRDAVVDEKLNKLEDELGKYEKLNEALTKAEAAAKADKDELQERVDGLEARLNRPGAGQTEADEEAKAYRTAFFDWARRDKEAFTGDRKNVLQVSDDNSAGYLAPVEFVAEILKEIVEVSPMRGLVTVRTTSHRAIQMPRRTGRAAATWVGEVEQRANTEGLAYGLDDIPVFEANMRVPVSLQMLEDSEFNLEDEIREEVSEGFGEQEGAAIIAGNAVKKPQGILNAAGVIGVNTNTAATITADALINLKYALKTGYARNGSYILNRPTLGKIRLLKDGNGQYLWASGLAAGRANTIDGELYTEMPDMPNVGAGLKPVAFGDWKKGYTLVERLEMQMLRDPFTAAEFGQVIFNWRRRLGGAVRLAEAIAVLTVQE